MFRKIPASEWQRALVLLSGAVLLALVVAALYWAQAILIPFALAAFLTFVLSPFVMGLQRWGLPRVLAVLTVAVTTALVLTIAGWIVSRQVSSLVQEMPAYTDNIKNKLKTLKESVTGNERLQRMMDEINAFFRSSPPASEEVAPGISTAPPKPTTVVVEEKTPAWLANLPSFVSPLIEFSGQAALALVLLFFMLLKREDLRNRLIRLVGDGHITLTTKAFDDATQRISRFLLMQAIINTTFGMTLSIGLFFLDVRYAILCGFLAALLRYAPYVGPIVSAVFPILISFAMSGDWTQPLLVIGLVLVLELLSNNLMEPWLYGQSIGVSEVAQLFSAAFWAFLWGPIGLVLSAPLTVVLLVLGKNVDNLQFLAILLGDEPPLTPQVNFYQRLVAKDGDEALELLRKQRENRTPEEVCDDLLVPALNYMQRDGEARRLEKQDQKYILQFMNKVATESLVEDAADEPAARPSRHGRRVRILGCCARNASEAIVLRMMEQLMPAEQWEIKVAGNENLTSDLLSLARDWKPEVICISSMPPGGLQRTRQLCKRLRYRLPKVKLLIGRWHAGHGGEEDYQQLLGDGSDFVETSLQSARERLKTWFPILNQAAREKTDADSEHTEPEEAATSA